VKRTICEWCKQPFDAHRSDARYCGSAHRAAAAKARRQNRSKAQPAPPQRPSTALTSALTRAIRRLPRTPHDPGLVALARSYARTLDRDPDLLAKLGPQYLAVLIELGMTRGRARTIGAAAQIDLIPGPTPTGPAKGKLDELRARRQARET
jgi:hypothetical protein